MYIYLLFYFYLTHYCGYSRVFLAAVSSLLQDIIQVVNDTNVPKLYSHNFGVKERKKGAGKREKKSMSAVKSTTVSSSSLTSCLYYSSRCLVSVFSQLWFMMEKFFPCSIRWGTTIMYINFIYYIWVTTIVVLMHKSSSPARGVNEICLLTNTDT